MKKPIYLGQLEDIAREAGEIQMLHFSPMGVVARQKADDTPITLADKEINKMVIRRARRLDVQSEMSIIGEEGKDVVDGTEWCLSFDPIDGTFPYAAGIPTFCFSAALLHNGSPVTAVVYDPVLECMFTADKGKGVRLNGKLLPYIAGKSELLSEHVIGTCWWPNAPHHVDLVIDILRTRHGCRFAQMNSIIYTAMRILTGKVAASVFPGGAAHDSSSIQLIIEEWGGKVTSIFGEDQRYDEGGVVGHLASTKELHPKVLEIIKEVNGR